ncbi:MAG: hypothetical protein IIC67_07675 [Thaumarchaeota archaeon]|nr:hypothetical protein [Nitrososphaerota archaeon]
MNCFLVGGAIIIEKIMAIAIETIIVNIKLKIRNPIKIFPITRTSSASELKIGYDELNISITTIAPNNPVNAEIGIAEDSSKILFVLFTVGSILF